VRAVQKSFRDIVVGRRDLGDGRHTPTTILADFPGESTFKPVPIGTSLIDYSSWIRMVEFGQVGMEPIMRKR